MNSIGEHSFSSLFKKYRLRSEFENLSDFGDALAQKQLHFENSLFSHWQKGDRMPKDRHLLIIILKIFVERDGVRTLREANEFFAAAGHGYLSDAEISTLPKKLVPQSPFQAPREISYFTGREQYLKQAEKLIMNGNPLLINASAGMGKSSTAIRLAHLLREDFPDGVLWYRLDTTSPESVLNAIAMTYGENISSIRNIYNKAAFIRSLLNNKKVLIIFDNLEKEFPLDLILPASPSNAVIVTSRHSDLADKFSLTSIPLDVFHEKETDELFAEILGKTYLKKQKKLLLEIASLLGHLPLALHLIAKQLNRPYQRPEKILKELKEKKLELKSLIYEDKNLLSSLELVFDALSEVQKKVFTSLGVFEGADFSLKAVAYINNLTQENTEKCLNELISASLVEYSDKDRYRLHPVISIYSINQVTDLALYKKTAEYYSKYLNILRTTNTAFYQDIEPEKDNILKIIKKCYQLNFYNSITELWDCFGRFLWNTGRWQEAEEFGLMLYNAAIKTGDSKLRIICCVRELSWAYFWSGQINTAKKYTMEALTIAKKIKDPYLIAYSKERLGKVYQGEVDTFTQAISWLKQALSYFIKTENYERISNTLRYMGEAYILIGKLKEGKKYLEQSLEVNERVKDKFIKTVYKGILCTHLGAISLKEKNYDKSLKYFTSTSSLDEKTFVKSTGTIWNNIGFGLIYEHMGDELKAQEFFKKAKTATIFFDLGNNIEKRHISSYLFQSELNKSKFYDYLINKSIR